MSRRERFQNAENFIIYYGHGEEKKLCGFDIAIIEPDGHLTAGMKRLRESQCLTIGYLSIIEINPSDKRKRYLKEEDFIKCNGEIKVNQLFNNYLVDIRSKRWQDILMHECSRIIEGLGYDGIFLDTIGNVENPAVTKEYGNSLISETTFFIDRLRNRYPDHIIIQNTAVEKLINFTCGIIDGICWENPPLGRKDSKLWMDEIVLRLNIMKKADNLKILVAIESDNADDSRKLQVFDNMGYLTYLAPKNYLKIGEL